MTASHARGYLLDTRALLWWLAEPSKLSDDARSAIADGSNTVCVSAAAAWEIAVKKGLGRLDVPNNLPEVLHADRIEVLPITLEHALAVADLPMHHQDPFDRMQIAQAKVEALVLVTRDALMSRYDVPLLNA
ncbi:MAG: type II toxin-antitoxin system VapC family toxin [Planctomycetota bacterium]